MTESGHRVVAIIQARMGSSRLPGKVLLPLCGEPLLWHVVERLRRCTRLDGVMIATTQQQEDDAVEVFANTHEVPVHRGPTDNVLARYVGAMEASGATVVVRITADNPLVDPDTVDRAVGRMLDDSDRLDCVNVGVGGGFPRGLDCEVMTRNALMTAYSSATTPQDLEHVSLFILRQRDRFKVVDLSAPNDLRGSQFRLSVDERDDYRLIESLYKRFYQPGRIVETRRAVQLLHNDPQLASLNAHVQQKSTI